MDFETVIRDRYSVRHYQPRQIEEHVLKKILEAGHLAPTGVNAQPHRIYVIQSPEGLEKIRRLSRCAFDAPTVLLFTYDRREDWKNPLQEGIRSGEQDVSIVATHVMLEAWNLGVGSCWVDYFPNEKTREEFQLSQDETAVLLMPLGYPSEKDHPSTLHFQSRPMEETVHYL